MVNGGHRQEAIFHDDPDREQLLATRGKAGQTAGWEVQAVCQKAMGSDPYY